MIILVTAGMFPNTGVKDDTECRVFSEERHGTKELMICYHLLAACFLSSLIGETKISVWRLPKGPGRWPMGTLTLSLQFPE